MNENNDKEQIANTRERIAIGKHEDDFGMKA